MLGLFLQLASDFLPRWSKGNKFTAGLRIPGALRRSLPSRLNRATEALQDVDILQTLRKLTAMFRTKKKKLLQISEEFKFDDDFLNFFNQNDSLPLRRAFQKHNNRTLRRKNLEPNNSWIN